jgi:hypothetical protein
MLKVGKRTVARVEHLDGLRQGFAAFSSVSFGLLTEFSIRDVIISTFEAPSGVDWFGPVGRLFLDVGIFPAHRGRRPKCWS